MPVSRTRYRRQRFFVLRDGRDRHRKEYEHNCERSDKFIGHTLTPYCGTTGGALPPSPLPAGGPDSSFLPFFANVTNLECAQLLPSRARQPNTVTVSPGNIVSVFFQPTRLSTTGG